MILGKEGDRNEIIEDKANLQFKITCDVFEKRNTTSRDVCGLEKQYF